MFGKYKMLYRKRKARHLYDLAGNDICTIVIM